MLAYSICFSLSDLLHSVWQTLGPSSSLQITQFRFFLWLSNIPLYIWLIFQILCKSSYSLFLSKFLLKITVLIAEYSISGCLYTNTNNIILSYSWQNHHRYFFKKSFYFKMKVDNKKTASKLLDLITNLAFEEQIWWYHLVSVFKPCETFCLNGG